MAVSVYAGNTADATTLMPDVAKLRADCGLERLARGTLKSEAALDGIYVIRTSVPKQSIKLVV